MIEAPKGDYHERMPLPVVEEVVGLDPWRVCQQLASWKHLLFLDSAQESHLGRYSYVTADPFAWVWPPSQQVNQIPVVLPPSDPFSCLTDALTQYPADTLSDLPPFQGGAAGLFPYDLCHYLERLPRPRYYDFPLPDLAVGLFDWVISFDHLKKQAFLVSTGYPEMDVSRRSIRASERIKKVRRALEARTPVGEACLKTGKSQTQPPASPHFPVSGRAELFSNFQSEQYRRIIRQAIDYIHAGDCFQVNIAQRLLYPARAPAAAIYERLRLCNPAPFAGYFDLGGCAIASASPERFLKVTSPQQGGVVETRPIKGTTPRGLSPEEDFARAEALHASAKDRAENIMIVDLLRNDLGRVCEYGSVRVDELCRVESFRTVHHLVSEVCGRLRAELGPVDLLRAAFPGGSVTGAPKIRAMEIITELEQTARGAYCGSLGFIGFDGAMDTSLLIRTFTIGQGWVQFAVGGGIVADSDPDREYEETWHKAEGMLGALEG